MNWDLIGTLAEVISAIAVVVTLAFLAMEIRNSRATNQTATLNALSVGFNETNYNIVQSKELADLWEKGLGNPGELDSSDLIRFSFLMQCYLNHCTALHQYHELKVLPDEDWEDYLGAIVELMASPGGEWLESRLTIPRAVRNEIKAYGPPRQDYGWSLVRENPPNKAIESDA